MERCRRFVLWFIAAILAVPLLFKGHGEPVAFAHYSTPMAMVRLRGDTVVMGINKFSDGVDVATVINMTAPAVAVRIANKRIMTTHPSAEWRHPGNSSSWAPMVRNLNHRHASG